MQEVFMITYVGVFAASFLIMAITIEINEQTILLVVPVPMSTYLPIKFSYHMQFQPLSQEQLY